MTDALVSVRMPKPLATELRSLTSRNNYLDFSEQLRSIIRQKASRLLGPAPAESSDGRPPASVRNATTRRKEELLRELRVLLLEEGRE